MKGSLNENVENYMLQPPWNYLRFN